jgi:hypothetical protein
VKNNPRAVNNRRVARPFAFLHTESFSFGWSGGRGKMPQVPIPPTNLQGRRQVTALRGRLTFLECEIRYCRAEEKSFCILYVSRAIALAGLSPLARKRLLSRSLFPPSRHSLSRFSGAPRRERRPQYNPAERNEILLVLFLHISGRLFAHTSSCPIAVFAHCLRRARKKVAQAKRARGGSYELPPGERTGGCWCVAAYVLLADVP